jgi:peptidylprolyl isomerase
MSKVKDGDKVKVHYTGKLEDGTVFDSSKDRPPFEFTIGRREVIPGFEKNLVGMEVGDRKTMTVTPEEGYGDMRDDLLMEIKIGQRIKVRQNDGNILDVTIAGVKDNVVIFDANHPLAGKALTFDVELVDIAGR